MAKNNVKINDNLVNENDNNQTTTQTGNPMVVRTMFKCSGSSDVFKKGLSDWPNHKQLNFEVEVDFSDVSQAQLINWSLKTLIIDYQKELRKCSLGFAQELSKNLIMKKASELRDPILDSNKQILATIANVNNLSLVDMELIQEAILKRMSEEKASKN